MQFYAPRKVTDIFSEGRKQHDIPKPLIFLQQSVNAFLALNRYPYIRLFAFCLVKEDFDV